MKKSVLLLAALSISATATAQTNQRQAMGDHNYTYGELRFLDVDVNGGDGFQLGGSYDIGNDWILVGSLTSLDFNNNVDRTMLEFGGGFAWGYTDTFDLVGTLRLVWAEVDTPFGDDDDLGFAFSAGTRGWIVPNVEIRGSVNHINLDNSDTYLGRNGSVILQDHLSCLLESVRVNRQS